ncbi:MAG: DUF2933 domain-containing protein [Actinobacteria bacterium]|nr:DUF2933 domain-containing protein [Actinomycetota bacterium]MBI3685914.1 DUF2933 domain-containing protein [Actinomycetota bacterium]
MKRQPWGLHAIALACPLMMMFMMRGMRGSDDAAPTDRYGG